MTYSPHATCCRQCIDKRRTWAEASAHHGVKAKRAYRLSLFFAACAIAMATTNIVIWLVTR